MADGKPHGNWRPPPPWAARARELYEAGESPRMIASKMDGGPTVTQVVAALRKAGTVFRSRTEAVRLRRTQDRADRERYLQWLLTDSRPPPRS